MATRDEHRQFQTNVKALTTACTQDDLAAAKALLQEDPTLVTASDTALLEACKLGRLAILTLFLDAGASVEALDYPERCDRRPLTSVLGRNKNNPDWTDQHRACLQLLLDRGASIDYQPGWAGHSGISAAATGDNPAAIEILRPLRGDPLDIYESAALGDLDWVRQLVERDPDAATRTNTVQMTALQYCAHSALGTTDPTVAERLRAIADLLLDHGCPQTAAQHSDDDPCDGYDPIRLAGRIGNEAVLGVLARRGDDSAAVFRTAIFGQLLSVLEALKTHQRTFDINGIGDDRRQNGFLGECCRWGLLTSADWLLDHGVDVQAADADGWTALHYAARRGVRPELIQRLLDAGADPQAKTATGERPIDLAKKAPIRELLSGP